MYEGLPCKHHGNVERFPHGSCKLCHLEATRKWRAANPERTKELDRMGKARNREKVNARAVQYYWNNRQHCLDVARKTQRGWSREDFDKAWAAQKGLCEICSIEMLPEGSKYNSVSADHIEPDGVKIPRGLLCNNCNRKLGWFEKNLSAVLKYLIKYGSLNLEFTKLIKPLADILK